MVVRCRRKNNSVFVLERRSMYLRVLDYVRRRRWRSGERTCASVALCVWLLGWNALGAAAKQTASSSFKHRLLPRPSYAFSKVSGLSAVMPPGPLLDARLSAVQPATTRNVTTQVGQTTYLHCIVDKLEDKTVGGLQRQVSWLSLPDFHLLTVGLYTYTSDTRFTTIYNEYSTDWTLQIKYPQLSDEGLYECQVSSDPPISHHVYLKVLVPKTRILGGENLYVSVGSEVNLTCVITECPDPPAFVFWYHGAKMINYDAARGDITLHKAGNDTAVSRLRIRDAQPADSGNYSCCPSNAEAASVYVNVLRGEKQAAVQNDAGSPSRSSRSVHSARLAALLQATALLVLSAFATR